MSATNFPTDHYDIYIMNADGSGAVNVTNHPGYNTEVTWSRDGLLAFVRDGDIWVMNADGSNAVDLTANLSFESSPAWTPDGKKVLFVSSAVNWCYYPDPYCWQFGSDLYVMNRDGSGLQRLTTNAEGVRNPTLRP